ncbi:LuxS/MPP-like metallohydrolase [Rhizodiscina lignyota]|uniref:Cytochrome b-c1 complex subunit 2, mitochondrial n=1 Tax=Rhizodiscina lignyota TaxID=1504668 RepID=A0A9P4M4W4_9PEZI|nr:LuxS/MPP-like metallohydrolase [Rhizodiscina lignyota]
MISRSAIGQSAGRALRRSRCTAQPAGRRGLAAPASGSFQYQTADVSGTKIASRDLAGPTTALALVSKAGSRSQWLPGLSEGLEGFAFKNTNKRSALRITREVELLGGEYSTYRTREALVLGTKFMREDLPYFVELLSEIATQTKYQEHVWHEEVEPHIKAAQSKFLGSTLEMATNSAHGLAFHRGLGTPLFPTSSVPTTKYLDPETIEAFSYAAYAKPNIALVANGADSAELQKWVGEYFAGARGSTPEGVPSLSASQAKYHGGEERIAHAKGNTIVIAFPGSSSFTGGFYKPEIAVLACLLGGKSSIKWSPGYSLLSKGCADFTGAHVDTNSLIYSDAGLLAITITGVAKDVAGAAAKAVETIKAVANGQIAKEDIQKAVAQAKFKELDFGHNIWAGIELTGSGLITGGKAYQLDDTGKAIGAVTEDQLKKVAKSLLDSKASVSTVGDLFALPYAEDLGLKV